MDRRHTNDKLSSILYKLLYQLHVHNIFSSPWLLYVQSLLNDSGYGYVWENQQTNNAGQFLREFKQRVFDQYRQTWAQETYESPKCINYRMFKSELSLEHYITELPMYSARVLTKFRCRNHKLPIEKGCHLNIERHLRHCTNCNSGEVGDEFHYLFRCVAFHRERRKYLPQYCWSNASALTFNSLMNSQNKRILLKLVKFINIITSRV